MSFWKAKYVSSSLRALYSVFPQNWSDIIRKNGIFYEKFSTFPFYSFYASFQPIWACEGALERYLFLFSHSARNSISALPTVGKILVETYRWRFHSMRKIEWYPVRVYRWSCFLLVPGMIEIPEYLDKSSLQANTFPKYRWSSKSVQ